MVKLTVEWSIRLERASPILSKKFIHINITIANPSSLAQRNYNHNHNHNQTSRLVNEIFTMQFFQLSIFLGLAAAAIATPIQLESRSLFGCYRDVAATQVDCLEACGDTSATDCTNAWYVLPQILY